MSTQIQREASNKTQNKNIEKLRRKHVQEQQKRIKPKECLKYIRCIIDPNFLEMPFGSQILLNLSNLNIKHVISKQLHSKIILWERSEQQILRKLDEDPTNVVEMTEKYILESQILHLMNAEEFVNMVKQKLLKTVIEKIKSIVSDASITVIIYGLKNYSRNSTENINRSEIEENLIKLQIECNCNHRLLETAEEVGQMVSQFSKAIAEIPFKKQQSEKFDDVNLFLLNDNKDCVRVDGYAGLYSLWQHHLTRLPLITLETAEAVINEYPQPKKLLEAYENSENGEELLADLKVRRSGGPLQSNRRIGPELSKKIHKLYTTLNPNENI